MFCNNYGSVCRQRTLAATPEECRAVLASIADGSPGASSGNTIACRHTFLDLGNCAAAEGGDPCVGPDPDQEATPTIEGVSPTSGQGGTRITIQGAQLLAGTVTGDPLEVTVAGVGAEVISASNSEIVVRAAPEPDSRGQDDHLSGPVVVVSDAGDQATWATWAYQAPGQVQTVSPNLGTVGTRITVRGMRLRGAGGSTVVAATVDGVPTLVVIQSATEVVLEVLPPDAGHVAVPGVLGALVLESDTGARVQRAEAFDFSDPTTVPPPTAETTTQYVVPADRCTCADGQYAVAACSVIADVQCAEISTCMQGLETEAAAPSSSSDRECVACTRCGDGTFEIEGCTLSADTQCRPWTACTAGSTFELYPGTPHRDRICTSCSGCSNLEFESAPCTPTNNYVCQALQTCSDEDEYELSAPTATTDRSCGVCEACVSDQFTADECSTFQNRECLSSACAGQAVFQRQSCTIVLAAELTGQFVPTSEYSGAYGRISSATSRNLVTATVLVDGGYSLVLRLEQVRMAGASFRASIRSAACGDGPSAVGTGFDVVCDGAGACTGTTTGQRNLAAAAHGDLFSVEIADPTTDAGILCADAATSTGGAAVSNATCKTACPRGMFRNAGFDCCEPCTGCGEGTHAVGGCAGDSDTICASWTVCGGGGLSYARAAGTAAVDVECAPCSTCGGTTWMAEACSAITDVVCVERTSCAAGASYEEVFGSAFTDRSCTACTECGIDPATLGDSALDLASQLQYAARSCSPDLDALCAPITACGAAQFAAVLPTATTNTVCQDCSECSAGVETIAACLPTADTLCSTSTTVGAAGAPTVDPSSDATNSSADSDATTSSADDQYCEICMILAIICVVLICCMLGYFGCRMGKDRNDPLIFGVDDPIFNAGFGEDVASGGKVATFKRGASIRSFARRGSARSGKAVDVDSDGTMFGFEEAQQEENRRLMEQLRLKAQAEAARLEAERQEMLTRVALLQTRVSSTTVSAIKTAQDRRSAAVESVRDSATAVIENKDQRRHGAEDIAAVTKSARRIAMATQAMVIENKNEIKKVDLIHAARKEKRVDLQQERDDRKAMMTELIDEERAAAQMQKTFEAEEKVRKAAERRDRVQANKLLAFESAAKRDKLSAKAKSVSLVQNRFARQAAAKQQAELLIAQREIEQQARAAATLQSECTNMLDCSCPDCSQHRLEEMQVTVARNARLAQLQAENKPSITFRDLQAHQGAINSTATENTSMNSYSPDNSTETEVFGFPAGFGFPAVAEPAAEEETFGFPSGFGFPTGAAGNDSDSELSD